MAMLNYIDDIAAYIAAHFTPSNPDVANFRHTTPGLLGFLFMAFPRDCISDYELDVIMNDLGYRRWQWLVEQTTSNGGEGEKETFTISKTLVTGWCLHTEFDLRDETIDSQGKRGDPFRM